MPASANAASGVQRAMIQAGRRLTVHDVVALHELDAAFRAWAESHGPLLFEADVRLARAVATVLHVELVEIEDDD